MLLIQTSRLLLLRAQISPSQTSTHRLNSVFMKLTVYIYQCSFVPFYQSLLYHPVFHIVHPD
jgi:hypothetical protein